MGRVCGEKKGETTAMTLDSASGTNPVDRSGRVQGMFSIGWELFTPTCPYMLHLSHISAVALKSYPRDGLPYL